MTTVVFTDLVGSTALYERLGDKSASEFVTQLVGLLQGEFEQHRGRIVKLLGDGLFVVFESAGDALAACTGIQQRLLAQPVVPNGVGPPVQVQMGIESGDIVEINGDYFGDAVNSAARLADLAGGGQILATQNVWAALLPLQKAALRSMGPMYLRGRTEASHVYRVEWQSGRDEEATMAGRSMFAATKVATLELIFQGKTHLFHSKAGPLTIGRAANAEITLNDPRVSRLHATLEWRGGNFVLTDASSYGTWVYLGNQSDGVLLRRTECSLAGTGHIVPGSERTDEHAPLIAFSLKS